MHTFLPEYFSPITLALTCHNHNTNTHIHITTHTHTHTQMDTQTSQQYFTLTYTYYYYSTRTLLLKAAAVQDSTELAVFFPREGTVHVTYYALYSIVFDKHV